MGNLMVKGHKLGLMEENMLGNGYMANKKVMVHKLLLMGSMLGNGRMINLMVKELSLGLKGNGKETSMLGNTRMGKNMVKEH